MTMNPTELRETLEAQLIGLSVEMTIDLIGEMNEDRIHRALHLFGLVSALHAIATTHEFTMVVHPVTDKKELEICLQTQIKVLASNIIAGREGLKSAKSQKRPKN